jgi:acetyl-CoA decarbonylase/synthase complex subunit delta
MEMEDMSVFAESGTDGETETKQDSAEAPLTAVTRPPAPSGDDKGNGQLTPELIAQIRDQIVEEVTKDLKVTITRQVVSEIIRTLSQKFLEEEVSGMAEIAVCEGDGAFEPAVAKLATSPEPKRPTASERLEEVEAFKIREELCEVPVWVVKLGANKDEGGTRRRTYTIGGSTCMPFHLWEGQIPNRPLVAMEVFDVVGEKYPASLRDVYGELLNNPVEMARVCVEKYGADLVSVRLDGTHPEKGNRTPAQAVELVKAVLTAVDVPLIITGHNHFDRHNEVMKAIAQGCAGENLLINWVEQDNYRTIAGAALAYGHTIVAQSPIDVNIAKQLNILLTNMDIKPVQIVMDPMTGAMGYGIEYTYSVMERIRLTGLTGDRMLAGPMIVTPGQECAKIKELKATEDQFPAWGDLTKRAILWELSTAVNLLYAGADILIMYHPEAAVATKRTIFKLMDGNV